MMMNMRKPVLGLLLSVLALAPVSARAQSKTLLNVSYDPTRELYRTYNVEFIKYWKEKSGETVAIQQSHPARAARHGR